MLFWLRSSLCRHSLRTPIAAAVGGAGRRARCPRRRGAAAPRRMPPTDFESFPSRRGSFPRPIPARRAQVPVSSSGGRRWRGPIFWKYNHANAPRRGTRTPSGTVKRSRRRWCPGRRSAASVQYRARRRTAEHPPVQSPYGGTGPDYETVVGWGSLADQIAGITYVWSGRPPGRAAAARHRHHPVGRSRPQRTGDDPDGDARVGPCAGTRAFERRRRDHERTARHRVQRSAVLQPDDVRGCRCLYGPAAGQAAGYSCSLPKKVDFGIVPLTAQSPSQTIASPTTATRRSPSTARSATRPKLVKDAGCAAGTVLQRGQSCAVQVSARGIDRRDPRPSTSAFDTSDGRYRVPVNLRGRRRAGAGRRFPRRVLPLRLQALLRDPPLRRDHQARQRHPRRLDAHRQELEGVVAAGHRHGAGVPVLQRGVRAEELALLHVVRFRMRQGQGEPGLDVRGRGVPRAAAGAGDGTCAAGLAPVYRLYNGAGMACRTTASPPTSRSSGR